MLGLTLVSATGISFALRENKIPSLTESWLFKFKFMQEMLACSFCTGFHSGWLAWFLFMLAFDQTLTWRSIPQAVFVGFASAIYSLLLDSLLQGLDNILDK